MMSHTINGMSWIAAHDLINNALTSGAPLEPATLQIARLKQAIQWLVLWVDECVKAHYELQDKKQR